PTVLCFFFNDTATTEIYTLSLHDALPIFCIATAAGMASDFARRRCSWESACARVSPSDSSPNTFCEATSGTQSHEPKCELPLNFPQSFSWLVSGRSRLVSELRACRRKRLWSASQVSGLRRERRSES